MAIGGAGGGAVDAATGTGSGRGGLGGAGRGGEVIVAVAEADAEEAVATEAGAEAGLNSTPQCTQNLAVGWFSLPQAAHFINPPSREYPDWASRPKPATRGGSSDS